MQILVEITGLFLVLNNWKQKSLIWFIYIDFRALGCNSHGACGPQRHHSFPSQILTTPHLHNFMFPSLSFSNKNKNSNTNKKILKLKAHKKSSNKSKNHGAHFVMTTTPRHWACPGLYTQGHLIEDNWFSLCQQVSLQIASLCTYCLRAGTRWAWVFADLEQWCCSPWVPLCLGNTSGSYSLFSSSSS